MRELLVVVSLIGVVIGAVMVGSLWSRRPAWQVAQLQGREVHRVGAAMASGQIPPETAAVLLNAIGPIRGSYADHGPGRCRHMAPYPGCRGGCA